MGVDGFVLHDAPRSRADPSPPRPAPPPPHPTPSRPVTCRDTAKWGMQRALEGTSVSLKAVTFDLRLVFEVRARVGRDVPLAHTAHLSAHHAASRRALTSSDLL